MLNAVHSSLFCKHKIILLKRQSGTSYNAFNKPTVISKGGITSQFFYGSDQMRYKQVKTGLPNGTETTLYVGKAYEEIRYNGSLQKKLYLGDVIITEQSGGSNAGNRIAFVHRDRLGSVVTLTDQGGNVIENRSYDPFGKPRLGTFANASQPKLFMVAYEGGYLSTPSQELLSTRRGFTDHEHLDDAELIHMNGRAYDYNLGRFLSVDPFVQSPGNSQSLNPYSYIMNNPLAGTDPSGYIAELNGSGCGFDMSGCFNQTNNISNMSKMATDNGFNNNQSEKKPKPETPEKIKPKEKKPKPCNAANNCIVIKGKKPTPEERRKYRQQQERRARQILEMQLNTIRRMDYYRKNPNAPTDRRFINQMPGGVDGPFISLINDDPNGLTTDQLVKDGLADSIENAVVETGLDININSTTGGHDSGPHVEGRAADINRINGKRADDPSNKGNVKKLQKSLLKQKKTNQILGPVINKDKWRGAKPPSQKTIDDHNDHIHVNVYR